MILPSDTPPRVSINGWPVGTLHAWSAVYSAQQEMQRFQLTLIIKQNAHLFLFREAQARHLIQVCGEDGMRYTLNGVLQSCTSSHGLHGLTVDVAYETIPVLERRASPMTSYIYTALTDQDMPDSTQHSDGTPLTHAEWEAKVEALLQECAQEEA